MRRWPKAILPVVVMVGINGLWAPGAGAVSSTVTVPVNAGHEARAAVPDGNWVLFTFTAGSQGARDLSFMLTAQCREVGRDHLFGAVYATESLKGITLASPGDSSNLEVSSTTGAGGLAYSHPIDPIPRVCGAGGPGEVDSSVRAGRSDYVLLFVPGMWLESERVSISVSSGSGVSSVVVGSGARALRAADVSEAGMAVASNGLAAGAASAQFRSVGLVGALEPCNVCAESFGSPDGHRVAWIAPGRSPRTQIVAGPGGTWNWSWQGVDQAISLSPSVPYLAAWAPIGRYWSLFEPWRA